jgi:hypothetical protein
MPILRLPRFASSVLFSGYRRAAMIAGLLAALALTGASFPSGARAAEKYQSRLNSLLIRKNDIYLPPRLVIGEQARFVVKAAPGSRVKLFLSTQGEGLLLPDGSPLRVGKDAQEVSGTVPDTGVLQLQMDMPKEPELEGQVVYVDAVSGPSEDSLSPMTLVSAAGLRTGENTLTIVKAAEKGGPNIVPNMPGLSPQVFNQLTQLGDIYGVNKSDKRKELLDNGSINRDRAIDQNPFTQRGAQPGLGTPR